ncbi:PilZ domain-containing protein [Ensifer soli]|uniref:PilZ domain-containing protein n=1 Tax=Ciceribacter sp. sgz301302 TaxID=3342379 RepID=UPI0035BA1754
MDAHLSQSKHIRRSAPRARARFTAIVTGRVGVSSGVVKDLSPGGICFELKFDINARSGEAVSIKSEEFGLLTGRVQWTRGCRIGIKLDRSSRTDAQIASYFRFFR